MSLKIDIKSGEHKARGRKCFRCGEEHWAWTKELCGSCRNSVEVSYYRNWKSRLNSAERLAGEGMG